MKNSSQNSKSSTRITRDQMLMGMAYAASQRGTCNRLRVGAIIARESRPISTGYNGAPPGHEHCGNDCNTENACLNTIHAEDNAIRWAFSYHPSWDTLVGATMYTTHSPCIHCAREILISGITRVVFSEDYRSPEGKEYLINYGVEVVQCQVGLAISVN